MAKARLFDVLQALSDSWKAPPGISEADLAAARDALRSALATEVSSHKRSAAAPGGTPAGSGSTPTVMPAMKPRLRSELTLTLASTVTEPLTETRHKTLGPFSDRAGINHWVDLFPVVKKITIESTTHGVLANLIAKTLPPADLGAGSMWIATSALGLAGVGFIGLAFKSAKVHVAGVLQKQPGKIIIGPGVKLTLSLTLAPASAPAGLPGIGADAEAMELALPATATLELTADGVAITAFADCSAKVYDTALACKRKATPPQRVNLQSEFIVFPCSVSLSTFTVTKCLSLEVALSGSAPVAAPSGWAFPVVTDPAVLAAGASGNGALALAMDPGLNLAAPEQPQPVPLGPAALLLAPAMILIVGTLERDVTQRFTLWDASPIDPSVVPPAAQHRSEVRVRAVRGAPFVALTSGVAEVLAYAARVDANVDRPLSADGRRLALAFDIGVVAFVHNALGERIAIIGQAPNATEAAGPLALENALVCCGPARTLFVIGQRTGPRISGSLGVDFDLVSIVPTLPDPYAASFAGGQFGEQQARLLATVIWPAGTPNLSFTTLDPTGAPAQPERPGSIAGVATRGAFVLLDLSTHADQFGVQVFGNRQATGASVSGLNLVAPQQQVAVYALPGISWEPVVDDRTDDWYDAQSSDDGPPTRLLARSVTLVPTEPLPVLRALRDVSTAADILGEFTLPFGLTASLEIDQTHSPGAARPTLSFVPGTYAGVAASLQLAIEAGTAAPPGAPPGSSPALPGSTTTGAPVPLTLPTAVYGAEILGANEFVNGVPDLLSAAQFFDQQFADGQTYPEIPVTRIDISGYGTSMISDWREPNLDFVGVVRARFDVLVGRTAYELVQLQTLKAAVVDPHDTDDHFRALRQRPDRAPRHRLEGDRRRRLRAPPCRSSTARCLRAAHLDPQHQRRRR